MDQLGLIFSGYSEFTDPLRMILLKYDVPEFYTEGFDYLETVPLMQLAGAQVDTVPLDADDMQLIISVHGGRSEDFYREFERLLRKYYQRRATGRLDVLKGGGN